MTNLIDNPHNQHPVQGLAGEMSTSTEPAREKSLKEQTLDALKEIDESLTRLSTIDDIERVALDMLGSLPESTEISRKIDEARSSGNKLLEGTLMQRQREIYTDVCGELALIAGIETDEKRVARENDEYRGRLAELLGDATEEDVETGEVLVRMGMLHKDEDDQSLRFSYPEGVFPPHIDEKWEHYKDLVAQHVGAIGARNAGIENDVTMIAQLDAVRRAAHNNLSLAIKDFLQLDSWDLDKCRRLVIKMRDAKFPTMETAEKEVTAEQILRLVATVRQIKSQ